LAARAPDSPPASPDDDSARRKERLDLLSLTAERHCADLNASVGLNPTNEHYAVDPKRLRASVDAYFDCVDGFKGENGLHGRRFNRPKQAALTALAILEQQPILAVRNVPDTVHLALANQDFAFLVGLDLIGLTLDRVEDEVQEEFLWFLRQDHVPERLLVLAFDLLHRLGQARLASRLSRLVAFFLKRG
jgi:hypothetical protein